MDGNQFFRDTFFASHNFSESLSHHIEKRGISKNSSYDRNHPQSNLSYSTKPIKSSKKSQKQFFSQKKASIHLKSAFESFQIPVLKRQRRYLSTIEKRNFESSFQDVSPWNSSITPKENSITKNNFSKQREKIKQMIHEYRLNKTIDQNVKQHANFIKSSKSKKKKINMVLLQYNKGTKPIQRPLSLIKSVDVNKSYENYLNNGLQIDEKLFKIPIKIKNQNKKQIFSCRMHTKQSQKQKDKTIKQQVNQIQKKDLICSNYLDELKVNLSHQDLIKEKDRQKAFQNKKLQQKVLNLRNQRNKNGLRNQRQLRSYWQESRLTPKILVKQQKLDFSVSGNKTHKLQCQKTYSKFD